MQQCLPFIEALNRESGLQIELSGEGSAAFAVDDRGVLLQWSPARSAWIVYVELARLAGYRDSEIIARLMSANFLLHETKGGALSLDPTTNTVGLNYSIPVYGLSPDEFVRVFDAVIELSEQWSEDIRGMIDDKKRLVEELQKDLAAGDKEQEAGSSEMLRV